MRKTCKKNTNKYSCIPYASANLTSSKGLSQPIARHPQHTYCTTMLNYCQPI